NSPLVSIHSRKQSRTCLVDNRFLGSSRSRPIQRGAILSLSCCAVAKFKLTHYLSRGVPVLGGFGPGMVCFGCEILLGVASRAGRSWDWYLSRMLKPLLKKTPPGAAQWPGGVELWGTPNN